MYGTDPQTAQGKVLWHFCMSLDGYVAGPQHAMDWMEDVEVFSADIGRQLLELGLIDEIDLQIAPILLGDGIRLYDNPGAAPIRLDRLCVPVPTAEVNVRYRPHRPHRPSGDGARPKT